MDKEILFFSQTIEEKILLSCHSILAAFFPGQNIRIVAGGPDPAALSVLNIEKGPAQASNDLSGFQLSFRDNHQEICKLIPGQRTGRFTALSLPGKESLEQILVKRTLFLFLTAVTGKNIPWGILSGIRPGKLVSKMNELAWGKATQTEILHDLYLVNQNRIDLLCSVAEVQKPYLQRIKASPERISVYLGIPFCPSRCFYCSFPSQPLTAKNRLLLENYLQALHQEIRLTAEMMRERGLTADCLYIGGGTPTSLETKDLEGLFQVLQRSIPTDDCLEYTVEAGRPDSINRDKLILMKNFGVNRISINPQSMQEHTLPRIGRNHSVADIRQCYELARMTSDWVINMDLILGLPGEGPAEMLDSLAKVLALKPDNLTIHALAVKRGSAAWESKYRHQETDWMDVQTEMIRRINRAGYQPYYLYRQKNIAGNLENIGYALPAKACRYNIAIIEEKQNIIGLGAGAASKILKPDQGHYNLYNSIDIKHYIEKYPEFHQKRKKALQS